MLTSSSAAETWTARIVSVFKETTDAMALGDMRPVADTALAKRYHWLQGAKL
jgi:hypothetical protein